MMNRTLNHQSSQLLRRLADKSKRPLAMVLAAMVGFGGLTLAQSWLSQNKAQAADGSVLWGLPITDLDDTWLYGASESEVWAVKHPEAASTATAEIVRSLWTRGSGSNNGGWTSNGTNGFNSLAIGPDRTNGNKLVAYQWGWNNIGAAGNGNRVAVRKVTPGSTVAEEFAVPRNANNGPNYWSGGEVFQGTGELYFSPGEAANVQNNGLGTAQMQVCKPWVVDANKVMECKQSNRLQPATPGDRLIRSNGSDSDTTNWTIGSDMVLDAEGAAYLLASYTTSRYLIKVTPGAHDQPWKWQKVLMWNNSVGANTYWGMAFVDGKIYARGGATSNVRMNPLTKDMEEVNWVVGSDKLDMASAQTAANIRGHVWQDTNGDGQMTASEMVDENGVAGLTIELYKEGQSGPVSTTETDGTGEYNFLIDSLDGLAWYVRVMQPQIDGYNATQTYAAGYTQKVNWDGDLVYGNTNQVSPRCQGQAEAAGYFGPCLGSRPDGIDPSGGLTTANVYSDAGALMVTKAVVSTSGEVSVADFGITVTGSYGDAPASFKSTRSQGGPLAFQQTAKGQVFLGDQPGSYEDGTNDSLASDHATDDGLEVRDHGAGEDAWVLAQDQILAVGRHYDFRAKLSGDDAADGFVKAWFAELQPGGAAATSYNKLAIGASSSEATPDAKGYVVLDNYEVPSTIPTGGIQNLYIRARAGLDVSASYAGLGNDNAIPAPGNAAWDTQPWVETGEVEDYRLAVATGTVKLQARTLGDVASKFDYSLTNIAAVAPSTNTDSIITNDQSEWQTSSNAHAFTAVNQPVVITTTSVPAGWRLGSRTDAMSDPIDTYCMDPATGDLVDFTIDSATQITLASSAVVQGASLVCRLTYVPIVDLSLTNLTTTPTPDSGDPLQVSLPGKPGQTYQLQATLVGRVTDEEGVTHDVPVPGATVTMTLAPAGPPATATGAYFTVNSNQSATCQSDAAGQCTLTVAASAYGTYTATAKTEVNSSQTAFNTNSTPGANRHPAELYFKAGAVASGWISLDDTADKVANHGVSGEEPYDYYTLHIYLTDGTNPVTGQQDAIDLNLPAGVLAPAGVVADTGTGPGHYSAQIYATKAAVHQISAEIDHITLVKQGTVQEYVTATFVAMAKPCTPGVGSCASAYTLDNTGTKVADGVEQRSGLVTLKDANGNPLVGQATHLTFDVAKDSTPVPGAKYSITLIENTAPGYEGQYDLTITSTLAGDLEVQAVFDQGVSATEVVLGSRTASFVPGTAGPGASFTITGTPGQIANHGDPAVPPASWGKYVGTVHLEDANGNPITDAASRITLDSAQLGPVFDPAVGATCAQPLVAGQCLSGDYQVDIYSTKSGNKTITAIYAQPATAPVTLGPDSATFVAGPADPAKSVLVYSPAGPVEADGSQQYDATVTVRDYNQNLVSGQVIRFELAPVLLSGTTATGGTMSDGGSSSHTTLSVTSSSDGLASITVTAIEVGSFTLAAYLGAGSTEVTDSPATLTFASGGVSIANSDYTVTSAAIVADGVDSGTITVRLFDSSNHPLSGLESELDAYGPAGQAVVVGSFTETSTPGTYTAAVSGTKTGLQLITATWEGALSPSPASLPLAASGNDSALFVNGPPDPTKSGATIQPTTSISSSHPYVVANSSDSYTITVSLFDAQSNPVTDWYSALPALNNYLVSGAPAGAILSTSPIQGSPGFYTLTVRSATIENYTIEVAYGQLMDHIVIESGLAAAFNYGWPVTPSGTVTIDAGPKEAANPSSFYTVTVKLVDSSGHKITDGVTLSKLALAVTSGNAMDATITSVVQSLGDPSLYTVQVTAAEEGTYVVGATYDGMNLGSVNAIFGGATPDPAFSYFEVSSGSVVADGTAYGTVTVHLNNSSDLPVDVDPMTLNGAALPTATVGSWERLDKGEYQAKVTSTVAGVKTITVSSTTVGAISPLAGDTITFVAGPVDITKTLASLETQGGQARTSGADPRWARMMVQDAYGNPIGGQSVCFVLDYGGASGPLWNNATSGSKEACSTSSSAAGGSYGFATINAYSYYEGSFNVRGKIDSTLGSTTKPIVYARDTGHPDHSEWSIEKTDSEATQVVANGSDSYTATITIRNQDDEPVFAAGGSLEITPSGTVSDPSSGFTTSFDGTAEVVVTSTISGTFTVRAYIGDDEIGSAKTITFVPGPVSTTTSKLTSPATPAVANGSATQVIRAEVRDAYGVAGAGNLISGASVVFTIPAGVTAKLEGDIEVVGPNTVTVTTGSSGPNRGVASLTLVSEVADTYLVTATANLTAITAGSPASATFINGPADKDTSTLAVPTKAVDKQVRSQTHTAVVTLRDAFGNLVTSQSEDVTIAWRLAVPGTGPWTTQVVSSVAGVATHSFTTEVAGVYEVRAWLDGEDVDDSPQLVTFVPGDPSPEDSVLAVSAGLVNNNGTTKHTATVTVLDGPGGNLVPDAAVTFTVSGSAVIYAGPGETICASPCTVTTAAGGQALIKISDTVEETVTVSATIDAIGVTGSPATVQFGPSDADPDTSSWDVTPTVAIDPSHPSVLADGSDSFTATVTVRDMFTSVVGGVPVDFQTSGLVQITPGGPWLSVASGGDKGTVVVELTSTVAGTYSLSALLGGVAITGSPKTITFTHGEIDGDVSYLSAPPSSALANGVATRVVTAYVLDPQGNPVSDAEVTFQVPAGTWVQGETPAATYTTPVNPLTGVATMALQSVTAGTYHVTAAAERPAGGPVEIETGSPAAVVFRAGAFDPDTSTITVSPGGPLVADGVADYTVTVTLKDAFGNAVTSALGQTVTYEYAMGSATASASATVNASGVATTQFATTLAGQWEGRGYFNGTEVLGGSPPVLMPFVAGDFSPAHSTFAVSTSQVLANGLQKHWGKVQLYDAFLNPVVGQDVTFTVLPSGSGIPGPFTNGLAGPVTVTSCDPEDLTPPEWCTVDEVFQTGLAYVQFTSNEPGTFDVTASSLAQRIPTPGAVKQISFTAGLPSAANSSWTLTPDSTANPAINLVADGVESYELTARIKSPSDILVDAASVRLNLRGSSAALLVSPSVSLVTGTPTAPVWGEATWQIASNTKGVYEFDVQVNNGTEWVTVGSPVVVRFGAGEPNAANSWLIEPDAAAQAGLGTQTIVAELRDVNGLLVDDAETVTFTVPAGLSPTGTQVVPASGGKATLVLSSTTAGSYDIVAEVADGQILTVRTGSSPAVTRSDGNAKAIWTAGIPSAEHSTLFIPTEGDTVVANGTAQHTAKVQVMDQTGNNPVAGVSVVFTYGWDESHTTWVTAVSDASGVATINFSSTKAAVHTVTAKLAGAEVKDSPAEATFVAGPLDPAATLATLRTQGGTAKASGYQPLWAQMTAVDQYGNPVSGAELEFFLPYAGTEGPVFAPLATGTKTTSGISGANGVVRVNLVSTWQGTFEVKGKIGAATSGAPARTVTFDDDAGDPAKSEWSITPSVTNPDPGKVVANGSDSYVAAITIRNSLSQALNGVGGTLTVTSMATGTSRVIGFVTGHDGSNGLALVTIDSLEAGEYSVTVNLAGNPVATTVGGAVFSQLIEFVAGPPSPLTSHLVSPSNAAIADGADVQVIKAVVRDAYGVSGTGNPVPGAAVSFSIPAGVVAQTGGGPVAGPATVVVTTASAGPDKGVAELTLTSTIKGSYNVTAMVGAMPISSGSPATARFLAGEPSAAHSSFVITTASLLKPVQTDYHHLLVQIKDANGNLIDDRSVTISFRWRLAGSTGPWSVPVQVTTGSGIATHDFTVAVAGVYNVEAYLVSKGQISTAKQATFVAGPASPADSIFDSSAGVRVPNNGIDSHWASVLVLDGPGGNPVANQPVVFTVGGSADILVGGVPCGQSCTVVTSTGGRVEITVVNTTAQVVRLSAIVAESEVGNADLEFGPGGPAADHSDWSVEETTPLDPGHLAVVADGVDSFTATVTVRDAGDLVVPGAPVTFLVPAAVSIDPASGPYLTDGAGQVQVTFTSTTAGTFAVRARVGEYIEPSPVMISFGPGPIDDPASFLEEPVAAVVANGLDKAVVKAHIEDYYGNIVTDATVRFSVPAGADVKGHEGEGLSFIDVAVNPATGIASLELVSTTAGTYLVTAEAKRPGGAWVEIETGSPAKAIFQAGPVDPTLSILSKVEAGPLVADGVQAYTVNAQLVDAYNNPVKVAGVVVALRFTLGDQVVARSVLTDATGVASYSFTTTKAGAWQATGRVYGQNIEQGSPLTLTFVPGEVDTDMSSFWTSEGSALSDGVQYHWVKALIVDHYGNPIGDVPVDFTTSLGQVLAPAPWFDAVTTNQAVQVNTCDPADMVSAAEWCWVDGLFQAGLAYAELRSVQPGTFDVTAKVDSAPVEVDERQVSFTAGKPDPDMSSYTLTPDTAADPLVKLPATGLLMDAYTLIVAVNSAADLPVDGAKVRLSGLPVSVTVVPSTEGATRQPGDPGYGTFTWSLYSSTIGTHMGSVEVLVDEVWQTVGDPFQLRFGSGDPAASASWLEGPSTPATAGPGSSQTVTAKVYDLLGNPADHGQVIFHVPTTLGADGLPALTPSGDVIVSIEDGLATLSVGSNYVGTYPITADVRASGLDPASAISSVKPTGSGAATPNSRSDGIAPVTFTAGPADPITSQLTVPTAVGDATKVADGVQFHTAHLQAMDEYDLNQVADVRVRFQWIAGTKDGPNAGAWTTVSPDATTAADGSATYDHISTTSGWIWFRAFIQDGEGDWYEVSNSPARAKFVAGEPDVTKTTATFLTYDQPVLNNQSDTSWARVQVVDARGNGVPGLPVVFTLPGAGAV
ncbi:MAG: Ig-like domain-containing protein, partial [Micrococcales bacterium]|nr:Ig-like domain-containing protein [Micrococcales bacterium]